MIASNYENKTFIYVATIFFNIMAVKTVELDDKTLVPPLCSELHLFILGAMLSESETTNKFLDKFRNLSVCKGLLRNTVLLIPILLWGGHVFDDEEDCKTMRPCSQCGYWAIASLNWTLPTTIALQLGALPMMLLALTSSSF